MNKNIRKHIVSIDKEYLDGLFFEYNADTKEAKSKVLEKLMDTITSFLDSKKPCDVLFANMFTDKNGKRRKTIEISPVLFPDNMKTLHYIRETNKRRRK